jgi:NADH-quinone oxidoreductase subunit M
MTDFNSMLLILAIVIPLAAAVLMLFGQKLCPCVSKLIAGIGFLAPAAIALWLWGNFGDAAKTAGYAYISQYDLGMKETLGISLYLGLNGISAPLFLLAGIVGLAAGWQAINSKAERLPQYLLLLLIMQGGLMGVFASIDIFFFYFFHELALIPTFIMIGIWGGAGRRSAAMQMTVYLTLGAMLSLLGLIYIYKASDWTGFDLIALREYVSANSIADAIQHNIFGLLLFGFGILVSLFPFHSWAPRGYAAAPTANAMLHAGVLKKFGLYGLVQIAVPLLPVGALEWNPLLIWLALGNILFIGIVTIAQRDLKLMVGYSSVMHMGYIFLGIATLSVAGVGGAVILMFAHGLSVALMFVLSTAVYDRTGTYDMRDMGGLGMKAPILAGFFVAATMASVGLPGFANFWGEFTIFMALWKDHAWAVAPAVLGIIISAVYGLRAAAAIFMGAPSEAFQKASAGKEIGDITRAERIPAIILVIGLVLVGFWPNSISTSINEQLMGDSVYQPKVLSTVQTPAAATPAAGNAHEESAS